MKVHLQHALETQKALLEQLLELNAHEFSLFDQRDLDEDGRYGYPYLDLYWSVSENRHPLIIKVDGIIAGCVLVRAGNPHRIAEFFILNKFRRAGVGRTVATLIFEAYPGTWEIEYWAANVPAAKFWGTVLSSRDCRVRISTDSVIMHFNTG
jgi:predicted acetyltransferase